MFFLIVGIRPRRRPVPSPVRRVHACPGCGQRRLFEEVRVVPYFDLFFIPLFPVGSGSRVLRCSHCRLEVPTTGVFTKAWDAEEVAPESVSVEEAPESRDWGFSGPGGGRRASTEEQIYCIHCGRRFRVRAHDGLQRVHCPVCERDFEIGL